MSLNRKKGMTVWVLFLVVLILIGTVLTACSSNKNTKEENETKLTQTIKIASLKGPTGMGLAYLMMQPNQYEITTYQSPEEAVSKLLSGEVDVAAVSSNLGAVLYNKTKGDMRLLSINTGGVLYLAENGNEINGLQDLKGKTILASGKGGTPEYVLKCLLLKNGLDPEKDLTIHWLGNHTDVAGALMAQKESIALLPEPFVSVVTAKNNEINIPVDLNAVWKEEFDSDLPMGIFLVSKNFAEERASDIETFLSDVRNSVKSVNEKPKDAASILVEKGVMDNEVVVKQAIPRCNIIALEGQEAYHALDNFYQILFNMEPSSIGGKLPDKNFYLNLE